MGALEAPCTLSLPALGEEAARVASVMDVYREKAREVLQLDRQHAAVLQQARQQQAAREEQERLAMMAESVTPQLYGLALCRGSAGRYLIE